MSRTFKAFLLGFGFLSCVGQAQADTLNASLNQFSSGVNHGALTSVGTIVAVDHVGYVDLLVTLLNGAVFINTGGGHTPFVFNLSTPTTASSVTPVPATGDPGFTAILTTPVTETGLAGNFSNGIQYVNLNNTQAQNGGGHGDPGPLEFHLNGVTVHDFIANSGGFFFGADVLACSGVAGTTCSTGAVGSSSTHITPGPSLQVGDVPEPSTWAMMILGFAGVGFMAYRRCNGAAPVA